jgi:lipopolysaccharide transport system permease protein
MEMASRSAAGIRVLPLLNPLALARNLWSHRELALRLARRDIIGRYRSSWLGVLWAVVTPLAMLGIYTFVFAFVFTSRWNLDEAVEEPKTVFAITMFCGMLVFNVFAEVVSRAPSLVADNPNYVKKVVFPLETLVVSSVLTALFTFAIGLGVWLAAWLLVQQTAPSATLLLLPVVLLPACLLALGCGWLLASLGVFFRDIGHVIALLMQILFFATPIFYPIGRLPAQFQPVMRLNPLSPIVENARRVMMHGLPPDWGGWAAGTLVAACVAVLGFAFFMKSKRAFGDVL